MAQLDLYINGTHRPAEGGRSFTRANPVTGEIVATAAAASLGDATRAVDAAASAFPAWSNTTPGVRRKLLLAAAQNLTARADEIVQAMKDEIGA
uniref:aldehyde dehydrogenase family protein n=1 Tax=Pararhodobacter oceanensis TaxID=2172121 RepID=UPI003A8EE9F4